MVNIYYEFLKQKKEIRQMTEENTSIQQNTDPSTGVESTGSGESIDWEKKYHEEVKQSKSYRSRAQEAESSLDKFNQKQSSDRKKKLESEGKLQQIIDEQDKLIIDLKTTSDLDKFQWSAKKYNYDSQAFVYKNLFGYDMIFIAIDKNTGQIGIFDCSEDFLVSGFNKVEKANEVYDLFYKTEGFEAHNYFINKTL